MSWLQVSCSCGTFLCACTELGFPPGFVLAVYTWCYLLHQHIFQDVFTLVFLWWYFIYLCIYLFFGHPCFSLSLSLFFFFSFFHFGIILLLQHGWKYIWRKHSSNLIFPYSLTIFSILSYFLNHWNIGCIHLYSFSHCVTSGNYFSVRSNIQKIQHLQNF